MNIESVKIVEGKLLLTGEGCEFYLMDGVYRCDDGQAIAVRDHQIVTVLTTPDLESASREQLEQYIADLEQQLTVAGNDAQVANIDLQNMLQKQQQTVQMITNISKMLHDTAMAIVRKIG